MSIDAKILGPKGPPLVFEALGRSFQMLPTSRKTKVGFQKYHLNKMVRDLEPTKAIVSPEKYQEKLDAIASAYEAGDYRFETIFTDDYLHSEDGICELTAFMMQCSEDDAEKLIAKHGQELAIYLRLAVREGAAQPHGKPGEPVAVEGGDVSPN